jgi:acetolactate synthase-1/2/3 large subunit
VTRSSHLSAAEAPVNVPPYERDPRYGSDLVVDVLRALGVEYLTLNPGSSTRGIHDSLINYSGNQQPQMLLCNHENTAVAIAHGYYKATGKVMAAMLHDTVGVQNGCMAIFNAWCDRVPVLVLGANGPMEAAVRVQWIHWIHTGNLTGQLVRGFTKWDDQPFGVGDFADSLLRAYRTALTEPCAPVYVCFEADLQEEPLAPPPPFPAVERYRPAPPMAAPEESIARAAELLVGAEWPVAMADRVGRHPEAFAALQELATLLALPVLEGEGSASIPSRHPMNLTGAQQQLFPEADVVIGFDMIDYMGYLSGRPVPPERRVRSRLRPECQTINVSVDELLLRGANADHQRLPAVDVPILSPVSAALPRLLAACRALVESGKADRARIARRAERVAGMRAELEAEWQRQTAAHWNDRPISLRRLHHEVYAAVKDDDWVLGVGRPVQAPGVWDFTRARQFCGDSGGAGIGYGSGAAVGVALGQRGTGRLPVAITGDGDYLMTPTSVWTAVHYQIPLLLVIRNNRSYYNDEIQQQTMARRRQRPMENAWIGMRMFDPAPDLAGMARCLGAYGEGPIEEPDALGPALQRAAEQVRQGHVAVVDVVCSPGE